MNESKNENRPVEMQPLTPETTRQPLSEETLAEMQPESDRQHQTDSDQPEADQTDSTDAPNVVERQLNVVNRPAG